MRTERTGEQKSIVQGVKTKGIGPEVISGGSDRPGGSGPTGQPFRSGLGSATTWRRVSHVDPLRCSGGWCCRHGRSGLAGLAYRRAGTLQPATHHNRHYGTTSKTARIGPYWIPRYGSTTQPPATQQTRSMDVLGAFTVPDSTPHHPEKKMGSAGGGGDPPTLQKTVLCLFSPLMHSTTSLDTDMDTEMDTRSLCLTFGMLGSLCLTA